MNNSRDYCSDLENGDDQKTFFPFKRSKRQIDEDSCTPTGVCRGFVKKMKIPAIILVIIIIVVGFILTNNAIDDTYRYAFEINMSTVGLSNNVMELEKTIETQNTMIMYLYAVLDDQGIIKNLPKKFVDEYESYLESQQEPTTTYDDNDSSDQQRETK
jgi:nitrate/TMAO reductase-like tetraheme cytochrome c subunit